MGFIVFFYIMFFILWRLFIILVIFFVVFIFLNLFDNVFFRLGFDGLILELFLECRVLLGVRVEDLFFREENSENWISKFKRKDWSLSKFQVIVEKVLEFDLMSLIRKV